MQELNARVGQVDRYVILEPEDGWLRIAGRAAHHHRVAVFLDGLQRRTLHDARVAAWRCTTATPVKRTGVYRWRLMPSVL